MSEGLNEGSVITEVEQITAAWLTAVLRQNELLANGRVTAFTCELVDSQNSHMNRLLLAYSDEATGPLPASLMLKMVQTEPGEFCFGSSEVEYYQRDYLDLPDAPIPPCYHAAYDANQHAYHLLLADLTATHQNNFERKPTLAYGRAVAEALAILHAHWWDKVPASAAQIDRHLAQVLPGLEPMKAAANLPAEWAEVLRQIIQHHAAAMHGRLQQDHHFTLIHCDLNPGNILTPHNGGQPVYLVDRQPFDWSFTAWLGASDLAYMMVLWWESDTRGEWEMEVLRHYHAVLQECGVADYGWAQLLADYRLSVLQMVYVPLAWCTEPAACARMKWLWERQLKRVLTAVTELNCLELL